MAEAPDTSALHPRLRTFLEQVDGSGEPPLYMFPPEEARRRYTDGIMKLRGDPPADIETRDYVIEGPGGMLPMRMYRPKGTDGQALPVLVYFHGGGWSFGSIESYDHICRYLALHMSGAVVSVDYRLAPEHKFPAAVEDALAATRWVAEHTADLSVDPTHLGVGGDSAGGTLAAVTCILARDQREPSIACQLLIYPATDMRMEFASHHRFADGFRLTRPLMVWCSVNYMRDGRDFLDPRASPLLADDLSGLPPAHILTAGFDPLQDEGKAYAERLRAAGVHVHHDHYPDMIHGFIGMTGMLDTSREALAAAGLHLGNCLRIPTGRPV